MQQPLATDVLTEARRAGQNAELFESQGSVLSFLQDPRIVHFSDCIRFANFVHALRKEAAGSRTTSDHSLHCDTYTRRKRSLTSFIHLLDVQ